jgi:DNA-binding transcriptional LysR family regulator
MDFSRWRCCEVLNFTKSLSVLRLAQPALSRQIQDWEDEIGVDLLRRSPPGVNARGRREALLQEVRELLKSVDEKVEKTASRAHAAHLLEQNTLSRADQKKGRLRTVREVMMT